MLERTTKSLTTEGLSVTTVEAQVQTNLTMLRLARSVKERGLQ